MPSTGNKPDDPKGEVEREKLAAAERRKFVLVGKEIDPRKLLRESGYGMFAVNPFDADMNKDPRARYPHTYGCFDRMVDMDDQLAAAGDLRKRAVLGFRRSIEPADTTSASKKAAEICQECVDFLGDKFDTFLEDLLEAPERGLAFAQKSFINDGATVYLNDIQRLPQWWFGFRADGTNIFTGGEAAVNPETADVVEPSRIVMARFRGKVENPYGYGWLRAVWYPFLIKNILRGYSTDIFERFIEPLRIGTYKDPSQKALLSNILKKMGRYFGAAIPEGCTVQVIEQKGAAAYATMKDYIRYWDEQQLKIILGQPMTMGGGGDDRGTFGRAEIAQFQQTTLCSDDAKYIMQVVSSQVFNQIAFLNTVTGRVKFNIHYEQPEDKDKVISRALTGAKELGVEIAADWWHETSGVPRAKDGEEVYIASRAVPSLLDGFPPGDGGAAPGELDLSPFQVRATRKGSGLLRAAAGPVIHRRRLNLQQTGLKALFDTRMKKAVKVAVARNRDARAVIDKGRSIADVQEGLNRLLAGKVWPAFAELLLDATITGLVLGWVLPSEELRTRARRKKATGTGPLFYGADNKTPVVRISNLPATLERETTWDEVADLFKDRLTVPSDEFYSMEKSLRQKYFTVSTVENDKLLAEYKEITEQALREGWDFDTYKQAQYRVVERAGVDPLRPYHLETVFRTNIQLGYAAGRADFYAQPEIQSLITAFMWVAVMDDRTRPEHAELDGTVQEGDSEFWSNGEGDPPVDFGCRCDKQVVTTYDNIPLKEPPPEWRTLENPEFRFDKRAMLSAMPEE